MVKLPDITLVDYIDDDLRAWEDSLSGASCPSVGLQFAAAHLRKSLVKKILPTNSEVQDRRAIQLFKYINARNEMLTFDTDSPLIDHLRRDFERLAFSGPLLHFDIEKLSDYIRLGPGASSGTREKSYFGKLSRSCVTYCNNLQLAFFKTVMSSTPLANLAESKRHSKFGVRKVVGSNLTCVAKDVNISRLVCTEPMAAMAIQLAIKDTFETRLRSIFGIDLAVQPSINRTLAQKGSIDQTWATIDLKSASDCISLRLMQEILPAYLLELLQEARSPSVKIGREQVLLHMISTMGNGFTFPLQTFLFASVVSYVYKRMCIKASVNVFGDDIVVPTECYDEVCACLVSLGLIVNADKSFHRGPFRESCGGDYYRGLNVRGVYIKVLAHPSDFCLAYNLLDAWSKRLGISLTRTLQWLRDQVPSGFSVPDWESDRAGLKDGTIRPSSYSNRYQASVYRYKKFVTVTRRQIYKGIDEIPGFLYTFLRGESGKHRLIAGNSVRYRVVSCRTTFL
jgi:hypothetical protein